jgi:hypothetical protein
VAAAAFKISAAGAGKYDQLDDALLRQWDKNWSERMISDFHTPSSMRENLQNA